MTGMLRSWLRLGMPGDPSQERSNGRRLSQARDEDHRLRSDAGSRVARSYNDEALKEAYKLPRYQFFYKKKGPAPAKLCMLKV